MNARAPRRDIRGPLWVGLMVMLAIPIPFKGLVMPERGAPILYLIVAAALALFWYIGRTSWPLGLLLLYTLAHVLVAGYPIRGVQLLLLMALCGILYVEAAHLERPWAHRVAWAILAGAALQGALGVLNMFHIFPGPTAAVLALRWIGVDPMPALRFFDSAPWLTLLSRDYLGRPMGWLTHPNYWGSLLALAVPVAYVTLGRWAALVPFALVGASLSIGPIVSASAGLAVVAWKDMPRVLRPALVASLLVVVVSVSVTHITPRLGTDDRPRVRLETVTSGRTNVWAAAWPKVLEAPVFGNGVGSWRMWAGEYNRVTGTGFATLQAHNEALQLVFELGLVGLGIVLAWAVRLARRVPVALAGGPEYLMWAGVLAVALVNSLGSPTFHLPTQAAIAFFATARLEAGARSS